MLAPTSHTRGVVAAVALATLLVFGGLVAGMTWQLRGRLRAEVLRREAEAIHAVALMQIDAARERPTVAGAVDDLFTTVLRSKSLRGVFAVQLFGADGALRAALPLAPQEKPTHDWREPLDTPLARFDAHGSLEAAYGLAPEPGAEATRAPLLEVIVPLPAHGGVARYWIDGEGVAAEFARTDRGLAWQAGLAFAGGALVIALVFAWASARLAEANRRLVAQSADLARANQELEFAAKTGAIGAISAHLIHGLKNPLSGLEGFVADNTPDTADPFRGDAWRTAADTTRRLRALVNEVATVLRDEASGAADYRVPLAEMLASVRERAAPAAAAGGVTLAIESVGADSVALLARAANLASLVLANLLANAIESSSRGAAVRIEAHAAGRGVELLVEDRGGGLPAEMKETLFRPVRSTKPGGGGIGLAISYQLARHAGGELSLVRSDAHGTVFRLSVPTTESISPSV